jgi:hypothetical protein
MQSPDAAIVDDGDLRESVRRHSNDLPSCARHRILFLRFKRVISGLKRSFMVGPQWVRDEGIYTSREGAAWPNICRGLTC